VIAELAPSVWVRAAERCATSWPRRTTNTIDRAREAGHAALGGTSYSRTERWQQLRLDDVPGSLTRQLLALRLERGPSRRARGLIDRLILNAYGGLDAPALDRRA